MLTEAEANEVSQDSRVLACELNPLDQGIEFAPHWTQTGDFEKTTGTLETDDKNWGLYRMIKGDSVSSWGVIQQQRYQIKLLIQPHQEKMLMS